MIEVPLSSKKYPGLVALVDDEDAELVAGYTWYPFKPGKTFYAKAHVPGSGSPGKTIHMHQLVSGVKGIDHKDRNGLNNTRANLRVPPSLSHQIGNKSIRSDNTSGYKGVCLTREGRWQARIWINGKSRNRNFPGTDEGKIEAARWYDQAAREAWGEFAFLNFPGQRRDRSTS